MAQLSRIQDIMLAVANAAYALRVSFVLVELKPNEDLSAWRKWTSLCLLTGLHLFVRVRIN